MTKMIKLSKASKMPCKSFSLPAGKACIGMIDDKGKVKEVCQGCYAMKGSYNWRAVKQVRLDNLDIVKNDLRNFQHEMSEPTNIEILSYFNVDTIDNLSKLPAGQLFEMVLCIEDTIGMPIDRDEVSRSINKS